MLNYFSFHGSIRGICPEDFTLVKRSTACTWVTRASKDIKHATSSSSVRAKRWTTSTLPTLIGWVRPLDWNWTAAWSKRNAMSRRHPPDFGHGSKWLYLICVYSCVVHPHPNPGVTNEINLVCKIPSRNYWLCSVTQHHRPLSWSSHRRMSKLPVPSSLSVWLDTNFCPTKSSQTNILACQN